MVQENARLTTLKALLGIAESDTSKDILLTFALETVEGRVLDYINHETLPEGLGKTLLLMTVSYWKGAGLGTTEAAPAPVASVSRGNVSTSFAVDAGQAAGKSTFDLTAGDDFFGWKTTLNGYRKLRW